MNSNEQLHYIVKGTVSVPVEVIVSVGKRDFVDGGDIMDIGADMILGGHGTMIMEELTLDDSFVVEEVEI